MFLQSCVDSNNETIQIKKRYVIQIKNEKYSKLTQSKAKTYSIKF